MDENELQQSPGSSSDRILKLHKVTEPELEYYAQARELGLAKMRYAQAFQIAKQKGGTDLLAQQVAVEMTGAELTMYEAALRIAEERLS